MRIPFLRVRKAYDDLIFTLAILPIERRAVCCNGSWNNGNKCLLGVNINIQSLGWSITPIWFIQKNNKPHSPSGNQIIKKRYINLVRRILIRCFTGVNEGESVKMQMSRFGNRAQQLRSKKVEYYTEGETSKYDLHITFVNIRQFKNTIYSNAHCGSNGMGLFHSNQMSTLPDLIK